MILKGDESHQLLEVEWDYDGDLMIGTSNDVMVYLSLDQVEGLKLFLSKNKPEAPDDDS